MARPPLRTLFLALTSATLIGGWHWDAPPGTFLGHAVIAAMLAVLIHRARRRRAVAGPV